MDNATLPVYDDADPPDYRAVPVSIHDTDEFVRYHFPIQGHEQVELKTFNWSLRNSSWSRLESSASPLHGPQFECGGARWRILAYPGGVRGASGNVSLFLVWQPGSAHAQTPQNAYTCASFAFVVANPNDPTVFETQMAQHRFTPGQPQWGFARFVSNSALRASNQHRGKPVVEDDTLEIMVLVRVLRDHTGVLLHDFREYDSKATTGYVHLVNQGATDYFDAMLSSLFMITCYRKMVYAIPSQDANPNESTAYALQRLFYRMQESHSAVTTIELTRSFGWRAIDAFTPRDVFEFNRMLQERLEQDLKGTSREGSIERLFYGRFETKRECSINPAEHNSVESKRFAALKLPVAGMDTLVNALRELTRSHVCSCPSCPSGQPGQAARRTRITELPPVLTLVLDRFVQDPETRRPQRRPDILRYPVNVDMEEFLDGHPYARGPEQYYTLMAVIAHEAVVTDRGFFYAMVRHVDGRWLKFDDERVVPVLERDVLDLAGDKVGAAYGLLYVREADEEDMLGRVDEADIPAHIKDNIDSAAVAGPGSRSMTPVPQALISHQQYEVSVRVIHDELFRRHQGFDLTTLDAMDVPRATARWDEKLSDVMRTRLPRDVFRPRTGATGIRLRVVIQRQNMTCRVAWALNKADESLTLLQIKERYGSAKERVLVLYVEQVTATTQSLDPSRSLVFLKHFDPHKQTLKGWPPKTSILGYYEEIKPRMVEPMSLDRTFVDAEIDTGDIVCFERLDDDDGEFPPADRKTHFRNAVSFYRHLGTMPNDADQNTSAVPNRI
ncbi:cysteine proteinase [Auriculariales sp. MPI-PUGE-AT-0066]|nr:cysteine proteinase [Auriculariales sp. MPI-PUGE-AT-0066]